MASQTQNKINFTLVIVILLLLIGFLAYTDKLKEQSLILLFTSVLSFLAGKYTSKT